VPQLALFDQTFERVDSRAEVLVTLTEWNELDIAADRVEFALDVFNAPAIESQRPDPVQAVQLGDLRGYGFRIGRAAGERQQESLVPP
jgi:hypothetical protein